MSEQKSMSSQETHQSPQYLVDPTPDDFFSNEDYLDPINENTIFRRSGYTSDQVLIDLEKLYHSTHLSPQRAQEYAWWWFHTPIVGVPYENIHREDGAYSWDLGREDIEKIPKTVSYPTHCKPVSIPKELGAFDLSEGQVRADIKIEHESHGLLPGTKGWLQVDYAAGSSVNFFGEIKNGRISLPHGSIVAEMKGIDVFFSRDDLVESFGKWARMKPVIYWLALLYALPDSLFRLPVKRLLSSSGNLVLEVDTSNHPLLKHIKKTFLIPLDQHVPSELLPHDGNEWKVWLGHLMENSESSSSDIPSVLPRHYEGDIQVRSLTGSYSRWPSRLDAVDVDHAEARIHFDSSGDVSISSHAPVRTSAYSFSTDPISPLEISADFFAQGNIFDENPLLKGGLAIEVEAEDPARLPGPLKGKSHFQLEGDFAAALDDQGYLGEFLGNSDSLPEPLTLSVDGNWDEPELNLYSDPIEIPVAPGLVLHIDPLRSNVHWNDDEVVVDSNMFLTAVSSGSLAAAVRIPFDGNIIYNRNNNTLHIDHFSSRLKNCPLLWQEEEKSIRLSFNGTLEGEADYNLNTQEISGPLELKGSLDVLQDENNTLSLPYWLEADSRFQVEFPYKGILYRQSLPPQPQKSLLMEQGEQVTARPDESGSGASIRHLDDITLKVNQLKYNNDGSIWGDVLLKIGKVVSQPSFEYFETPRMEIESTESVKQEAPLLSTEEQVLDDWDLYLEPYGLDRETAKALLQTIRSSREISGTVDGFNFNLPKSRMITAGGFPLHVPKGCKPILDIRVVDGKIARFHFYFTKPLELVPCIPFIRGIYFDGGAFRLDLVNGPQDARRSPEFFKPAKMDPKVTQSLLALMPLPPEIIDRLMSESKLDPDYLENNADQWMKLMLLTMVAMGEQELRSAATVPSRSNKTARSPIGWSKAKMHLTSLQFKPGGGFQFGGVQFDFGCNHKENSDPRRTNNIITGEVDLENSSAVFRMSEIGQLHAYIPGNNNSPLDVQLMDGDDGLITLASDGDKTILRLQNTHFDKARMTLSPASGNASLDMASDFHLNDLSITKVGGEGDSTTEISLNYDTHVENGTLVYRESNGLSKQAELTISDSNLHGEASALLGEMLEPDSSNNMLVGGSVPRKKPADIQTRLLQGEWTITSPDLHLSQALFTPNITFEHSHIYGARLGLKNDAGKSSLHLAGTFDWKLANNYEVPLAKVKLVPGLEPQVTLDSVHLTGQGKIDFADHELSIVSSTKNPLKVSSTGTTGVKWNDSSVTTRFSGDVVNLNSLLLLDKNDKGFAIRLKRLVTGLVSAKLDGFRADLKLPITEEPLQFTFKEGSGTLDADGIFLEEGKATSISRAHIDLHDSQGRRNSLVGSADVFVKPGHLKVANADLLIHAQDEDGNQFPGIHISGENDYELLAMNFDPDQPIKKPLPPELF